MSEGSAVDDIMVPHVGCYVKRKAGGASGEVLGVMGERAYVHWGVQERHEYKGWMNVSELVVSLTAKQVKELKQRQKGMTYG